MKLQNLLSLVRRASQDFNMIEDNDRIAVGLSGGKDSYSLLIALSELRRFYPSKYELNAIMISLGLPGFDYKPAEGLCQGLGVNFSLVETDIGEIVFDIRKESNPCSLCSKMRKAALNSEANRLGCNKIALGHNKDDVCQTFFLSLFYEGRINTFKPVTYLDRTQLYAIRPLIYVPERDIINFVEQNKLKTVRNPCVVDGHTKREEMKRFIKERNDFYGNFNNNSGKNNNESFSERIFTAILNSGIDGWKRG